MGYQVPAYTIIKENGFYYIISDFTRKGPYQTKRGARKGLKQAIKNSQGYIIIEQYDIEGRLMKE